MHGRGAGKKQRERCLVSQRRAQRGCAAQHAFLFYGSLCLVSVRKKNAAELLYELAFSRPRREHTYVRLKTPAAAAKVLRLINIYRTAGQRKMQTAKGFLCVQRPLVIPELELPTRSF